MKFYSSLIIMLATINVAFGQNQAYTNDFKTPQQIRNYFASNIANIKPIEGEYDMQMTYKTNSLVNDGSFNSVIFIVSDPITNEIYLCANDNGRIRYLGDPKIEQIGTTNAYRVYWGNSSNRGILENGLRLVVNIELSQADSRKFAGNNNFAYRLVLSYDMVKRYPTGEMYANAARRAIEESQPKEWTGSGFALTNNYIVTNNHVVDGAKTIFIQGVNGDFNQKYHAEVVKTDKVNDLAIIKVNCVNIPSANIPYAVKTNTAEVGEEVFVLGYPLTSTMGEEIKLTTGVISSKTGFQGDVSIYQISAPIQPGNSGGPLFDSKGNVIGIVSSKHKGAENVSYAIKTSYLQNLMESAVPTNILPRTNKMASQSLSGKVKMAKNYIYYITCSTGGNHDSIGNIDVNKNSSRKTYNSFEDYLDAANAGDLEAQCFVAKCYSLGKGVNKDRAKAAYWYRKAAEQGYPEGQFQLGLLYSYGWGVSEDKSKALYWYNKAAEKGHLDAICNLGFCYQFGSGVTKDLSKAFKLFREAAEKGNARSQFALGECYEKGEGTTVDLNEAIIWYRKAADNGNSDAKRRLKDMK